ncbi:GNAT family N-acetyltransferase [Rhodanobacter umsongensis]|uniref:GNAT family N-acetyltransferase n=1 Tax=Rhodanobacter umsongensis TaxID=633153 RepID=A0ABW0JI89_9GAMM
MPTAIIDPPHSGVLAAVETIAQASLRRCRDDERSAMLAIIQAAAEAYRGVIPDDCWREPYMSSQELDDEIAAGVEFWGCEMDGALTGVMGVQTVRGVDLIRHAYVLPGQQGRGTGTALIAHLRRRSARRMLVGTWSAADWAIRFYRRHGFEPVLPAQIPGLLRTYWSVPERQIEASLVLADASWAKPGD